MKIGRLKIKFAADRTIPLLVMVSILGVLGVSLSGFHAAKTPSICVKPARQKWLLRCDGQGEFAGAMAFLDKQKIDLNKASESDFSRIPRLSHRAAQAIIKRRKELGYFRKMDELDEIKGVGPKTLERLFHFMTLTPQH